MKGAPIIVVLLGIIAVIILLCTHTVKEWEQALILQFGEAQRVENAWGETPEAGLKLKKPWEKVITLDRRNLEVDIKTVELVAADQERLVVDAFVRYRIVDGVKFYQEAYKTGLGTGTTYVLSPDSDFLGYLSNQRGPRR